MANEFIEFQIRTPSGRILTSIRGRLREAVVEVHQSLSTVDAVVSAYMSDEQSKPVVTGYMDGRGQIRIDRYLTSGNGTEFENWSDAYHHAAGWLPGDVWKIAQFVTVAPPSGVLGRAELTIDPYELPATDFACESGARRLHYGAFIIDAAPIKMAAAPEWTANFLLKGTDGRTLGPIGIHAYYHDLEWAVEAALSHAEATIDAGVQS
jgi:hypothetical protein